MNIYKKWLTENQKAVGGLLEEEIDYWLKQVDNENTFTKIGETGNVYNKVLKVLLPQNHSNATDIQNKVLAAVLQALNKLTNQTNYIVFREGHGRNSLSDYDVSEAIGWFTCKYPTKYRIASNNIFNTLDSIADCNNNVPNGGIGYDILSHFGPSYVNKSLVCDELILFNYLGDISLNYEKNLVEPTGRLITAIHSSFSSSFESDSQIVKNSLFPLNINAWVEGNELLCSLDIADSLGLDPQNQHFFVGIILEGLEMLLSPEKTVGTLQVTPFQKGLISYDINNPENTNYINQNAFEIQDDVSIDFFHEVCRILTDKYEILRACYDFDYNEGEFIGTILPKGTFTCSNYDLHNSSDLKLLEQILSEIKKNKFSIAKEPLIKFALIKNFNAKNVIAITAHHIIIDATSLTHLLYELINISSSLRMGKTLIKSVPNELKFSTYAAWINSKNKFEALNYWKALLADAKPEFLENKTIGESSSQNDFSNVSHKFTLNENVVELLNSNHLTIASALNYLIGFVLAKYCNVDSFIWGNTITVRPFELNEVETILGPCITTIPVTISLKDNAFILDEMKSLQLQVVDAQDYSHVTINEIANSIGEGQLFSVSYTYQNSIKTDLDNMQFFSYQTKSPQTGNISSHFPINILASDKNKNIILSLKYRRDYFTSLIIKDICEAIASIFNQLHIINTIPIKRIDLFSHGGLKKSKLKGESTLSMNNTLHGMFLQMVKLYPNKIAAIDSTTKLSYHELDGISNAVYKLISDNSILGAVGVRMKRSVFSIAVIIGILKAGCYVVSLEYDFPDEKVDWITDETDIKTVFVDIDTPIVFKHKIFIVDNLKPIYDEINLPITLPDNLCCINYTSGSTGIPKLVKISHAGHMNRILWLKDCCAATDTDIYGFKTLLCFGPSLREVFEPLTQGSTLYVYSNESNNNPEVFFKETIKYNVTRLFLTPTFIKLLFDVELEDALAKITYLEISGESIPVSLYERLRVLFPFNRIVGRYGATEAPGTVYHTSAPKRPDRNLALGKPIFNTGVVIANEQNNVLPIGIIGEINISGASISTGYINKKIESDNFVEIEGERHVKTGDLGYIDHSGILVLQGRKTRMLKINGYRVEPAEIEYNLLQHPAIKKVIIVSIPSASNSRLTAFYIKKNNVDPIDLRAFVEKKLPRYMIPHEFIEISKVPMTESGKVDYMSLSNYSVAIHASVARKPELGIEKDLFDIVNKLLNNQNLDVLSNFFEIGLDSIITLKMVYEVRKSFAIKIDASDIYMHPTIERLSTFIKNINSGYVAEAPYYTINNKQGNDKLFFVPPIGNSQIDLKMLENAIPDNITLVLFKAISTEDGIRLTIEDIATYYNKIVKTLVKQDAINLSGWSLGGTIAYEMAAQLEREGIKSKKVLLFDPGFFTPEYDQSLSLEKISVILSESLGRSTDPSIMDAITLDILKANKLIVEYKPASYSGEINLFKPKNISSEERNYQRKFNGLEQYCQGEINLVRLDGNHMTMLSNAVQNKEIIKYLLDS